MRPAGSGCYRQRYRPFLLPEELRCRKLRGTLALHPKHLAKARDIALTWLHEGLGQAIPVRLSARAGTGFVSAVDLPLTDEEDEPEEEEAVSLCEDNAMLLEEGIETGSRTRGLP